MNTILIGGITAFSFAIALILLRFWRSTRDRFFVFFAASFALMGLVRLAVGLVPRLSEHEPAVYSLNLFAMLLLVYAIIDKNREQKTPDGD